MAKLDKQAVCALRRWAWTTTKTYAEMAEEFGVSLSAAYSAIKGTTWKDVRCQYAPFPGDRSKYKIPSGDEADMMTWRVRGSPYSEIAARSDYPMARVKEILDNPSEEAHEIFLRTNGYRFENDPMLHVGTTTVPMIISILEAAQRGAEHAWIANKVGLSVDYVNSIVEGRRGGHKYDLAAQYMARKYGVDWNERRN